jgi:hypothetical protein
MTLAGLLVGPGGVSVFRSGRAQGTERASRRSQLPRRFPGAAGSLSYPTWLGTGWDAVTGHSGPIGGRQRTGASVGPATG